MRRTLTPLQLTHCSNVPPQTWRAYGREAEHAAKNPTLWRGNVRARHAVFLYQASWSASPLSQRLWTSSAISPYTEPLGTFFWTIIQRGSWTVFKRLPLLFAVALPIGLAQKQPARCCFEALVAYFAYCFFLSEIIKLSGDNLGLKYPASLTPASGIAVIDGIKTLDTGIIGPLAVSATVVAIHDRFYDAKVPDWLWHLLGLLAGLPHQLFCRVCPCRYLGRHRALRIRCDRNAAPRTL